MSWVNRIKEYVGGLLPKAPTSPPTTATTTPTVHTPKVTIDNTPPLIDPAKIVQLKALVTNAERWAIFGHFDYESEPVSGNPERIRFTDDWDKDNIIWVPISQLRGVPGVELQDGQFPHPPGMFFHKKAAGQLVDMWNAWERAGLIPLIKTFEGSFSPRFVRGSTSTLSNHAFGNAFDINYAWNTLGADPAHVGRRGSVRELVPIASQFGFFWGGNYQNRKDGMHFEVARIVS